MTCIVGLVTPDGICMGGDSAGVESSHYLEIRAEPKVFLNGRYLIGFTSSFRMGQLLQYSALPEPPAEAGGTDIMAFMVNDFVPRVRAIFREAGFIKKESDREVGGRFLVGVSERLFMVDEDFHVGSTRFGWHAIGSGQTAADAAMHATEGLDLKPENRVWRALSAASVTVTSVRPPFTLKFMHHQVPA